VTLTFTEPIDSRSSTIQVLDGQGNLVETGPPAVSGVSMSVELLQVGPGIYNVLWGNVSRIDGHAIKGSFPFTVLNPDGSVPDITNMVTGLTTTNDQAPRADGIAIRALSLLGLAMVAAGAVIALLWKEATPGVRRGLVVTVYAGAAVLAAATVLNLFTIRDAYSGVPLAELMFETQSGGYWLTRMGLVLLIAVVNTFAGGAPRRSAAALMGAVAVYLWAYTATSHAAAVPGSGWARGIDFLTGWRRSRGSAQCWASRWPRAFGPQARPVASARAPVLSHGLGHGVHPPGDRLPGRVPWEVDSASKLTETRYGTHVAGQARLDAAAARRGGVTTRKRGQTRLEPLCRASRDAFATRHTGGCTGAGGVRRAAAALTPDDRVTFDHAGARPQAVRPAEHVQ